MKVPQTAQKSQEKAGKCGETVEKHQWQVLIVPIWYSKAQSSSAWL